MNITQKLKTYKPFVNELTKVKSTLEYFHKQIAFTPFSISVSKILEIGSNVNGIFWNTNKTLTLNLQKLGERKLGIAC